MPVAAIIVLKQKHSSVGRRGVRQAVNNKNDGMRAAN